MTSKNSVPKAPPAPAKPPKIEAFDDFDLSSDEITAEKKGSLPLWVILLVTGVIYILYDAVTNNVGSIVFNTVGGLIESVANFVFQTAVTSNGVLMAYPAGGIALAILIVGVGAGFFLAFRLGK